MERYPVVAKMTNLHTKLVDCLENTLDIMPEQCKQ